MRGGQAEAKANGSVWPGCQPEKRGMTFRASGRSKLWENRLYQSRGFFKDKWIVSLRE